MRDSSALGMGRSSSYAAVDARSAEAAYLARAAGWRHAVSLEGGALAWEGHS
ncbi:MAG: hypothetical protein V9F04_10810 [Dermatophilaceae bacterium]